MEARTGPPAVELWCYGGGQAGKHTVVLCQPRPLSPGKAGGRGVWLVGGLVGGWAGLGTAQVGSLGGGGVPSQCGGSFLLRPWAPRRTAAPVCPPLSLSGACRDPCELSPCLRHACKDFFQVRSLSEVPGPW